MRSAFVTAFVSLALVGAACAPEPDRSSGWEIDEVPDGEIAREVEETPGSADAEVSLACAALEQALVGDDTVLEEPERATVVERLSVLVEDVSPGAGGFVPGIVDTTLDDDAFSAAIAAVDDATWEPCGFPVASAFHVVLNEFAQCEVGAGIGSGCDESLRHPTSLPCFEGDSPDDVIAVLCTTGEPAQWTAATGEWVLDQPLADFLEVDEAIG